MLNISYSFFSNLNNSSIDYCHWKSNEHLKAGLEGDTDLDILVDRNSCKQLYQCLHKHNFVRGNSVSYLNYSAIEDFIGFDTESGKLIHLHVHYELMIGKKFVKGIRLPWEKEILNNSICDESTFNIRTINPNVELILLFMRNFLKRHSILKASNFYFKADETKELTWLKSRVDYAALKEYCSRLVTQKFAELIVLFLTNGNKKNNKKLFRETFLYFNKYYNTHNIPIDFKYYSKKLHAIVSYVKAKKLSSINPYRRTLPQGGLVITFVGVDGSGKSTLIKMIKKWLSWKLDVYSIYFGSGYGSSSVLRYPIKKISQLMVKKRGNVIDKNEVEVQKKNSRFLKRVAKTIWAITLAMEKKTKIFRLEKARSKGLIVFTDRFPQTQTFGYNDGPLLTDWKESTNRIKRKIANWEYNVYNLANFHSPDIVIKLTIPIELALKRKKDTPRYMLNKKIEVINAMKFAERTQVISVNSDKTPEETALQIKKIIWQYLNGN